MKKIIDTVKRLCIFLAIFIAMQLVCGLLLVLVPLEDTSLSMCISYTLSMVLTLVFLKLYTSRAMPQMEPIKRSKAGFNPILLLAGVIFIFALSIVLSPLEELMPVDNSMYDDSVWTLIMVVVIAPIFEEILFRGKLYNMLRISASPLTSVVLASLLFGAVHLEPIIAISGLPWGLLLGFVYLRSRSIIAPIILHMFNNALAYATIVLSYDDKSIVELIDGERYFLFIYIVSALIVVIAMIRFVTFIVKYGRQNNNVVVVDTASQESVESGSVESGDEAC